MRPITIIQRIPLGVDPQYLMLQANVNPADILSAYQSQTTQVFLKSVECVDLLVYTVEYVPGSPQTIVNSYAWKGLNPNIGFDVAGVYQPLLRRIAFELPTECFYNKRYNGTSARLGVDLLHGKVDFGYNIDLNGLSTYVGQVRVEMYESAVMQQLNWHTAATIGGSSTQAYITLQYYVEILNKNEIL